MELIRTLYGEHAAPLWQYTLSVVHDPARAEAIVGEALRRASRSPEVLGESTNSARAWLFSAAWDIAVDENRSGTATSRAQAEHADQPARGGSGRALDLALVGDAVALLDPEHRDVIVCALRLGMSTHQIAAELDVPEETVKSRMHYGMRALRAALDAKGVNR